MKKQWLLIGGVPATGKTEIGNYLKQKYGFWHINLEDGVSKTEFEKDLRGFLAKLKKHPKVVITWGYMPVKRNLTLVKLLTDHGFSNIWFHTNYFYSLVTFIRREKVGNLGSFFWQISGIHFSKISHRKTLKVVYPYKSLGRFKDYQEIVQDIGIK